MRYLIKQKLLSLSEGFTIKDEGGNDCFKVKGKIISMGNKLTLYSMDDKELCFIEQKLMKLMPEYHISINGQQVMVIKAKMSFFTKKFIITGSAGEFKVEGNVIAKDFRVLKNGATVVTISRKLLAIADSYTVDIADTEDPVLMLATTVVLDMVCHNN